MIVPSMNSSELAKEIFLDSQMVDRKSNYLIDGLRRKVIKSKDNCYQHVFDYKSKRQNHWLILINYYKGQPSFVTTVYYLNERGINAIAVVTEGKSLYRFTPHFLIRYNERFLKQENISKLDLLKHFISHNPGATTEFGKANNDKDQCIFCRFTEGIALGLVEQLEPEGSIYHFRTFISNEMVHKNQQKLITSSNDYFEEYCHEMQRFTGIKTL